MCIVYRTKSTLHTSVFSNHSSTISIVATLRKHLFIQTIGNMTKADEESICGVKSIGSGEIKRQPSWSDINSLIGRIETLEQERGDAIPLVTASDDAAGVDDYKENNLVSTKELEPPTLRRRASSRRGIITRMMLGSRRGSIEEDVEEVEQKYDDFELPESTFTFLIAEPIISTSFGVGVVSYGMSLACLVLALCNELDNGTDDNPYGIAEVTMNVRAVQFLGVIIGVLMGKLDSLKFFYDMILMIISLLTA